MTGRSYDGRPQRSGPPPPMPRSGPAIFAALELRGFRAGEDDPAVLVYWTPSGVETAVRLDFGAAAGLAEIPDRDLTLLAGQIHLSLEDFRDLVDGTMPRSVYQTWLRSRGLA